ncbi:hypothetical protein [Enterococcus sp. DIV0756]|uniref:hypothetical protein n=1 Tax=Enterococcus sp. DIV0756 TaxID=2774636 RepID=UPI003F68554B
MRHWMNKQKKKAEWRSPFFRFYVGIISTSITFAIMVVGSIVLHHGIDDKTLLVFIILWILAAILSAVLDK